MKIKKKLLSVEEIEEFRTELKLTKTELAKACGITLPTLSEHMKRGIVPPPHNYKIQNYINAVLKEQDKQVPSVGTPITLGEVAKKERPKTKYRMPTAKELLLGSQHITFEYADFIRSELHVPRIFIDKAIGLSPGTWSKMGRGDKPQDLEPDSQKKVIKVLASLIQLINGKDPRLGTAIKPEKIVAEKFTVKELSGKIKEVHEGVSVVRGIMETEMPDSIHKRVALSYLEEVQKLLESLK